LVAKCAVWQAADQLDYVPISLEDVPRLLTSGRLPIDMALLQVSPPDARGFVSLGVSVDLAPAILERRAHGYRGSQSSDAAHPRGELRPSRPLRCDGGRDVPVTEYLHPKIGEVAERVARYIASIIEDGSTLQIGLGACAK